MSPKVLVSGVVAGIALFMWGFLTHMVIPLGETGFNYLPQDKEQQVLAATQAVIKEPGLYILPGYDRSKTGEELNEELEGWMKSYEEGPNAFLVYHPTGIVPMSPATLGIQLLCDLGTGVILAFVVSLIAQQGMGTKVGAVIMIGILTFLETDMPYANWWRFPTDYTAAQLLDKVGGLLIIGLILAAMIRKKPEEE